MIDLALLKPDSKSVTLELMAKTTIHIPVPHAGVQNPKSNDWTCTVSYIRPHDGLISPVYSDIAQDRSWSDIIEEAIACGAITTAGLYLGTAVNGSKQTTLDLVFTAEGEAPNLIQVGGISLTPTTNVTHWPPKKKIN